MASSNYRIGLMFSSTGPYSIVAGAMLNGALLAVQELRESGGPVQLEPVVVNPGGDLGRYAPLSAKLLGSGIRQVIGCYTSSSRKEVIPCFEKYDGLLWYPSHYEGFESSDNVIYTGAAPNQHILPLIDHLMAEFGNRAFCIGSNYIWAWENNRILREVVTARGGSVVAERYLPVGETELQQLVDAVLDAKPSFVFSSLIGNSGYAFFRLFRAACLARGIDQPRSIPVASCNLSEPELVEIGEGAIDGHLSSSVYFSTVKNASNERFVTNYARAFPDKPLTSADAEASYIAVKLLALALQEAGTDESRAVKAAVGHQRLAAPQGEVWVDTETLHCYLTPRIGKSRSGGTFDVIIEEECPVAPDPYLVRSSPPTPWSLTAPLLRLAR
ncbi:transporter substrate-binding domain-containing protein [Kaistia dalseonensis]|uniref:Branched-chain amino acid transport system substrate-binding protein n=1 Tax=Kaistia dalseonensis TaxID=410840 RepID=A0ABU0H9T3_9HYPH|nr:transporter substrate-binding domain-containing protein [Kaistia dalseonensis]MCX5495628.1 transporter substrate-binding domain-containing protein [Kaistia dalseonensis]MDQ0438221.1 branched-chain amino acid transport system substrate-binding protein [Kaistia dalseonensis]